MSYSVLQRSKKGKKLLKNCWKNVGKSLKKSWKNLEKSWKILKKLEKSWKNLEKVLSKHLKQSTMLRIAPRARDQKSG